MSTKLLRAAWMIHPPSALSRSNTAFALWVLVVCDWLQSISTKPIRSLNEKSTRGNHRRRPVCCVHGERHIPLGGATMCIKTSKSYIRRMLLSRKWLMGDIVRLMGSYRFYEWLTHRSQTTSPTFVTGWAMLASAWGRHSLVNFMSGAACLVSE